MPRDKRKVKKHPAGPDRIHTSVQVSKLINKVMKAGKKSLAERLVYNALDEVAAKTKKDPAEVLAEAIKNITPVLEVKARRIGGATYQVPVEVKGDRRLHLALLWLIGSAKERKGIAFDKQLAAEIIEAAKGEGNAIRKKEDVHKLAEANKALAHLSRY